MSLRPGAQRREHRLLEPTFSAPSPGATAAACGTLEYSVVFQRICGARSHHKPPPLAVLGCPRANRLAPRHPPSKTTDPPQNPARAAVLAHRCLPAESRGCCAGSARRGRKALLTAFAQGRKSPRPRAPRRSRARRQPASRATRAGSSGVGLPPLQPTDGRPLGRVVAAPSPPLAWQGYYVSGTGGGRRTTSAGRGGRRLRRRRHCRAATRHCAPALGPRGGAAAARVRRWRGARPRTRRRARRSRAHRAGRAALAWVVARAVCVSCVLCARLVCGGLRRRATDVLRRPNDHRVTFADGFYMREKCINFGAILRSGLAKGKMAIILSPAVI